VARVYIFYRRTINNVFLTFVDGAPAPQSQKKKEYVSVYMRSSVVFQPPLYTIKKIPEGKK